MSRYRNIRVSVGLQVSLYVVLGLAVAAPRGLVAAPREPNAGRPDNRRDIFAIDNLVAWCIVPFDAKHRSPTERAEMVQRLGLTKVAYDWRDEHVSSFEDEIQQYQQRKIEFFAFWSWHDALEPLIRKYDIHPQIWLTLPQPRSASQDERVKEAAEQLLPLVEKTRGLKCQLGIYNHGGWSGEPANMIAVCRYLREHYDADHVGIVYNLHHGHEHMSHFESSLHEMLPYLLCLNLNGMDDADVVAAGRNKILPIGSGVHERQLMKSILESGYQGPIGILDHRPDTDAEESLRANLAGLAQLAGELAPRP